MDAPQRWEHRLDLARPPRGIAVTAQPTCVRLRMPMPDRASHLVPMLLIAAVSVAALAMGLRIHAAGLYGAARWIMVATACAGLAFAVPVLARIALARREIVLTQGVLIMREVMELTCLRESVRAVHLVDAGREGFQLEVEAEFSNLEARVATGREPEVGDDEQVMAVLVLRGESRARAGWLARVVAAWAEVEISEGGSALAGEKPHAT